MFYAIEDSKSGISVFYLHGGAYFMDFTKAHRKLLKRLVDGADVRLIAPAYRLVPFATYREAFDFIVPLYREYREAHPARKIILMGDSAIELNPSDCSVVDRAFFIISQNGS